MIATLALSAGGLGQLGRHLEHGEAEAPHRG